MSITRISFIAPKTVEIDILKGEIVEDGQRWALGNRLDKYLYLAMVQFSEVTANATRWIAGFTIVTAIATIINIIIIVFR